MNIKHTEGVGVERGALYTLNTGGEEGGGRGGKGELTLPLLSLLWQSSCPDEIEGKGRRGVGGQV